MRSKPTDARAVIPNKAAGRRKIHIGATSHLHLLGSCCSRFLVELLMKGCQMRRIKFCKPPQICHLQKPKGKDLPQKQLQTSQMLTVDQMWTISRSFTENPCDFVINLDPHLYREGDGASCLGIG